MREPAPRAVSCPAADLAVVAAAAAAETVADATAADEAATGAADEAATGAADEAATGAADEATTGAAEVVVELEGSVRGCEIESAIDLPKSSPRQGHQDRVATEISSQLSRRPRHARGCGGRPRRGVGVETYVACSSAHGRAVRLGRHKVRRRASLGLTLGKLVRRVRNAVSWDEQ